MAKPYTSKLSHDNDTSGGRGKTSQVTHLTHAQIMSIFQQNEPKRKNAGDEITIYQVHVESGSYYAMKKPGNENELFRIPNSILKANLPPGAKTKHFNLRDQSKNPDQLKFLRRLQISSIRG